MLKNGKIGNRNGQQNRKTDMLKHASLHKDNAK